MIGTCESCGRLYCQECSDNEQWQKFCSKGCEDQARLDKDLLLRYQAGYRLVRAHADAAKRSVAKLKERAKRSGMR